MARKPKKSFDRKFTTRSVLDMALERIEHAYDMYDHIVVMFSGGKDSTTVLNLTAEVARRRNRLPLHVVFFDEEAIPLQTVEYVDRVRQRDDIQLDWYCLPTRIRNGCSVKEPYWFTWAKEEQDKWVRPMPEFALNEDNTGMHQRWTHKEYNGILFPPAKYGTVGMLMGIRAQESIIRHRMMTGKKVDNYITHLNDADIIHYGNVYKVYPIYDWTTEDVWTAPNKFGWDYNRAYDVMDKAGLAPAHQRCSPAFGQEALEKLWTYKTCFPEIWDAMSVRVKGANTAIRYSRTELYAYRNLPEKPDDISWEEFVMRFVLRHPEPIRTFTAKQIKGYIGMHYRKTTDPILEFSPHPDTAITWRFLLMLAIRSDMQGRKQPGARIQNDKLEHHWQRYNEERALYERGERLERKQRTAYIEREMG